MSEDTGRQRRQQVTQQLARIGGDLVLPDWGDNLTFKGAAPGLESVRDDLALIETAIRKTRNWRLVRLAYLDTVKQIFELDTQIVLADASHSKHPVGEVVHQGVIEVHHRFLIPFSPGGFLYLKLSIEGQAENPSIGYQCRNEYANHDEAGRAADHPDNDTRNSAATESLLNYAQSLSVPWFGATGVHLT